LELGEVERYEVAGELCAGERSPGKIRWVSGIYPRGGTHTELKA
jgi:hypothetical protein